MVRWQSRGVLYVAKVQIPGDGGSANRFASCMQARELRLPMSCWWGRVEILGYYGEMDSATYSISVAGIFESVVCWRYFILKLLAWGRVCYMLAPFYSNTSSLGKTVLRGGYILF